MNKTGGMLLAEVIGTFALCFVGAGVIIGGNGLLAIALAHGLILSVMISALGPVSGGHFNPAVTIGFVVTGKQEAKMGVFYIVAQLVGATLAGYVLTLIFSPDIWMKAKLGTPTVATGISFGTAILIEIILTFFLVISIWGTAVDKRRPDIGGLGIGLTVAADILIGGPLTGASMNPARTFGPALAGGGFDGMNHLVYWIGPIVGSILAAIIYKNFFMEKTD